MYEFIYINNKGFLTHYFMKKLLYVSYLEMLLMRKIQLYKGLLSDTPFLRKIPLFYHLLPFFVEKLQEGRGQGFNEKLKLGESIFLGKRARDEKEGSFRVVYFKRRELISPTPALALFSMILL